MKKISVDQIKSGALLGKPEKISVEIMLDGEKTEFDTFIMPFSYKTAVAQMQAYGDKKEALAGILASVICDEDGVSVFTEDDIRERFNQALVDLVWNKVIEINMLGKKSSSTMKMSSSLKSDSQQEKPIQKSRTSHTLKSKDTQVIAKSTEASTLGDESSKK